MAPTPHSSRLGRCRPLVPTLIAWAALIAHGQTQDLEKELSDRVPDRSPTSQLSFLIEYFQLDHRTANRLVREFAPKAANAKELRDLLSQMVQAGDATLIETGWLRCMSGQRAKTESVREDIYATEYDPPEIPKSVGNLTLIETEVKVGDARTKSTTSTTAVQNSPSSSPSSSATYMTSANPAAFETRNVGLTVEVDPVLGALGNIIYLGLSPEITLRLEDHYFTVPGREEPARGVEHIFMPLFYSMRTTTSISSVAGRVNLIGVHTPPHHPQERILVLIKATVSPSH